MTTSDFKIVFMGTPEFAVAILDKLYNNGVNIAGVVTAPDKPSGRGQRINKSAVKIYAEDNSLHLLQPTNLKDPEFVEELRQLDADLFVVVAFRMLPEVIWSIPPKGTINLHASLLPNYRGAAPINWAIINGEKETGVTTFFIEKEIDTGEIIERASVQIGENETVGELYSRLMKLGSDVMLSTVEKIQTGDYKSIPQLQLIDNTEKPAPKIFKDDCLINFRQNVEDVHNFCRGLSPYPAAWCYIYNKDRDERRSFKIYATQRTTIKIEDNLKLKSSAEGLLFPCADYYLMVTELQPEGKRKMNFKEFLAGNSIENLVLSDDATHQ